MGHEGCALGQALNTTQRLGKSEDSDSFEELGNLLFTAFDSDAHHATKTTHLLAGYVIRGVRLETGIQDILDGWVLLDKMGDVVGILG